MLKFLFEFSEYCWSIKDFNRFIAPFLKGKSQTFNFTEFIRLKMALHFIYFLMRCHVIRFIVHFIVLSHSMSGPPAVFGVIRSGADLESV